MAGGHPFIQVINENQVGVMNHIRLFHHADAPVEVGGKLVLEVVRLRQTAFHEESLVAHQHALLEAFPTELFWSLVAAHVKKAAIGIYDGSLTIHD